MGLFGKNAQQKRIDELAAENAHLRARLADGNAALLKKNEAARGLNDALTREYNVSNKLAGRLMLAYKALREIAESVTPHAAYRARKMAAVAKAALPAEIASHVRPKASADAHAH